MRRSGKTWFLFQCMKERIKKDVPRDALVYLNFEDERLASLEAVHLGYVLDEYFTQRPQYRDKQTVSFFFDEIQLVRGWETFIRRILDSEKIEVFVSGSSARMLSREVATSLRGRATETVIFPFSFRERLRHLGTKVPSDPKFVPKNDRSWLARAFLDYLEIGGFPEAQQLDPRDRIGLLSGYVDTCILRDIIERHAVSNAQALRWLVRRVLGSPGGLFSLHKVYQEMRSQGMTISKDTLYALLSHLEDAFLVRIVELASASQKRRQSNPRKIYPIDPGLIPVFDRTAKANIGQALENAVMIEFERRGYRLGYVPTPGGFEVDFMVEPPGGGKATLVQVAASLGGGVFDREMRAFEDASREHRGAHRLLLTLEAADVPDYTALAKGRVEVRTAWEWFLDSEVDRHDFVIENPRHRNVEYAAR